MRTQCAVAVMLACCAGTAAAADWSVDPKVTLRAETDDNHRMTELPGQEISVSGGRLDSQLAIRAATPRSTFRLIPRVQATLYPDDEDEETDNYYLRTGWDYRGERSEISLDADYSMRTILGRYFPGTATPEDGELGEPGRGEVTGRSTGKTDEERFGVAPAVAFELTERTSLALKAGYSDVQFDEEVTDDREDYVDFYGSAALRFQLSPTRSLAVIAGGSKYQPEGEPNTVSQSLSAEWSNRVSEISRIYVRAGANRVKSYGAVDDSWSTGFNGGAGVQWSFEVTRLFIDFNHYVDPSSFGRVVERDQLRFEVARQFSPKTTVRLAARGIQDGKAGSDDTFEKRKYALTSLDFDWRFTRQFMLTAGYQYAWREYEDDPTSAESNRFYLGITYEPHRL